MKRRIFVGAFAIFFAIFVGGMVFSYFRDYQNSRIGKLEFTEAEIATAEKIDKNLEEKYFAKRRAEAEMEMRKTQAPSRENGENEVANLNGSTGGDAAQVVYYAVATKGEPSSDVAEFRRIASETLNDARGWARAGVEFREVDSGGSFTLVLSEAQYLPTFSSVCSTEYSCRVGNNVVINDDRWRNASAAWNAAGGSLEEYRSMVVNHEVGHFLGHFDNEQVCAGAGQLAPLMQQQSINLRGCKFNAWPLESELWVRI